jgi:hypothetical protein
METNRFTRRPIAKDESSFGSQDKAEDFSLRFVAIENRVHDNKRGLVCRCVSANFAKRTARALNHWRPNERGQ